MIYADGRFFQIATWPVALGKLLNGASLDAVIDSGGGPIVAQCTRVLKYGGVVACYGCTSGVDAAVGMTSFPSSFPIFHWI